MPTRSLWLTMPDGDATHRAASTLRSALAGKPMVRFDAPRLIGPPPDNGRVVERVEGQGRHVQIVWDDNLVVETNLRSTGLRQTGSWHVYRQGANWTKPYQQMSVAIEVHDWVAVCFNAHDVEAYRIPDKRRHPGMGRLGPDLRDPDADLASVVNLLLSYSDHDARLGEVLLDQRVMQGIGNLYRCEVLWSRELSPFARVESLAEHEAIALVNTAATIVRTNVVGNRQAESGNLHVPGVATGPAVYGRNGQRCHRCGETVECRPMGVHGRMLYWCPGCQQHLHPRHEASADDTPMDPHPAAQVYMNGLPWNRDSA